ncbi:MAG: hypothetical protein IPM96_00850 [Ignavibacteria bacterium]|nr:hypothetical protein [Ignavibacteria bacterium]
MKKMQSLTKTKKSFNGDLLLLVSKEGKQFVVYSPALHLSSYGNSEKEALEMFKESLEIFLEETVRKGTLDQLLLEYGWSIKKSPEPVYSPPLIDLSALKKWGESKSNYKNLISDRIFQTC